MIQNWPKKNLIVQKRLTNPIALVYGNKHTFAVCTQQIDTQQMLAKHWHANFFRIAFTNNRSCSSIAVADGMEWNESGWRIFVTSVTVHEFYEFTNFLKFTNLVNTLVCECECACVYVSFQSLLIRVGIVSMFNVNKFVFLSALQMETKCCRAAGMWQVEAWIE